MPPPPPPKPAVDDGDQTDELAADHVRPAAEPKEQGMNRLCKHLRTHGLTIR
jgi:hypothetical protein